ncbi:hypothetical protein ACS0TY_007393 [Phlomoides rotata]
MRTTKVLILATIMALVFLQSVKPYESTRILYQEEQEWMQRGQNLLLPSFQRANRDVGPPSPNGCTWIPGSGGKSCTASITHQNYAGIASPPPPTYTAYPKELVQFGVATQNK